MTKFEEIAWLANFTQDEIDNFDPRIWEFAKIIVQQCSENLDIFPVVNENGKTINQILKSHFNL